MSEERVPYIAGPQKPEPEEERIFIFTKKQMCEICRKNCSRFDGILLLPDCGNCVYSNLPSIPRKEAIEIMSRACWISTVCAKNNVVPAGITKEQWDAEWAKLRKDYKKAYHAGQESALNSILEKAK